MSLIESYNVTEGGLHPVLIRDSWQVTTLNYSAQYHIENITALIKHHNSDRALSLLVGEAVLIACYDDQYTDFEIVHLKRGTSYNIPKNVAYAIAMSTGSKLFTLEKNNTHCDDVTVCKLSATQLKKIRQHLNKAFNHNHE